MKSHTAYSTCFKGIVMLFFLLFYTPKLFAQVPANNLCGGAVSITAGTVCTPTAGTLVNATYTAFTAQCNTNNDIWYSFTATTTNPTITIGGLAGSRRFQVLSGACGSLTSVFCSTAASQVVAGLTVGATYYVRVYSSTGSSNTITICIVDPAPPANDNCAASTLLTQNTGCTTTAGTLLNAVATAGVPGNCGNAASSDVWYNFVATSNFPIITLGGVGANFTSAGVRIQLLSGTCGAFTSLSCVSGNTLNTLSTIGGTGLTIGSTYYVRIYSNSAVMSGTTWAFTICVQTPTTVAPTVDFGKSYINLSKPTGGTMEPGDQLEMRATFVVRANTAYECSFTDNIPANTTYLPGTLRILTNEGKIFRQWTDLADGDPATITGTTVNIKLGNGANSATGGPISNTDRPSLFGSTCVLMATYRVTVNAIALGNTISVGSGSVSYKTQPTSSVTTINFPVVQAMLYENYGICANSVGPNSILSESGGTFGSGNTKDRAASNKVPANYTYAVFAPSAPQDYFYGMSNNTSTGTAVANYSIDPNETVNTRRVHNVWDILGDHTGASNPLTGNPPTDVNNGQSGGYMAVINASYRTDTAFLDTVRNLCPNTYYEYSAWFRNVCRKCGCDSTGTGASGGTYLPTGPGDSSGIKPTLTFNINGFDYYSTGDIQYTGQWIKKGFTYRTGPAETEMVINIRNNAPGGGGNDWAIDDIAVATCLPNMSYSPSLTPVVCEGNARTIRDTIRSYYDNYTHHIWQRSTNNGVSWTNLGAARDSVPYFNASLNSWEYISAYTIPPTATTASDSGDLYRVIVATTNSNLGSADCQVTDGASTITLSVLPYPQCIPLSTTLLSFNGKLIDNKAILSWSTSKEEAPFVFAVEKSMDGINFNQLSTFANHNNGNAVNYYSFQDPAGINGKTWYRIAMVTSDGKKIYSSVILLKKDMADFGIGNIINPFSSYLSFDIMVNSNSPVRIELLDMAGKPVRNTKQLLSNGVNSINLSDTQSLPAGVYTLRIIYKDQLISRRVIKKN